MDIAQKEWLAIVPYLLSLQYSRVPPVPEHPFRRFCYHLTQSDPFEYTVLFLVVCNVVEMCVWWRGMDPQLLLIKERFNLVISICFGVCISHLHLTKAACSIRLYIMVVPMAVVPMAAAVCTCLFQ